MGKGKNSLNIVLRAQLQSKSEGKDARKTTFGEVK